MNRTLLLFSVLICVSESQAQERTRWHRVHGRLVDDAGDIAAVDTFVWLESPRRSRKIPVHDELKLLHDARKVVIKDQSFWPRTLAIRTGQILEVDSVDASGMHHAVLFYPVQNRVAGQVVSRDGRYRRTFARPERVPFQFRSTGLKESAHLLVTDHPYATTTNNKGEFCLELVPSGEWNLVLWHARRGWITTGTQDGKKASWHRGRISVSLQDDTDLGEIGVVLNREPE